MSRILIFGGTTEGRMLAEYCENNHIGADVSVATEYGAELLPDGKYISVLTGRLDQKQMEMLIADKKYIRVIDATHPYAVEVTENIRKACEASGVPYFRLLRRNDTADYGTRVNDINELVDKLNESGKTVLSTLGSKEIDELTGVSDFYRRIWIRALPSEKIADMCVQKGFDRTKLILEKGPFSEKQNTDHILKSGAEILVTKESGTAGGFMEKVRAAQSCGTELIILARPQETGYDPDEIIKILEM